MPTLNLVVAAVNDDADETNADTGFDAVGATVNVSASATAGTAQHAGFRFQSVAIPRGAIISSAIPSVWCTSATFDNPRCDIYCHDIDDSPNFTTDADVFNRALTTASTEWIATGISTAAYTACPDITAAVQEVIDRAGWASGNALMVIFRGKSDLNSFLTTHSYDAQPTMAAKLDITYTAPASGGKGSGGKGKGGNTPGPGVPPKKPLRTSLSKGWQWRRSWMG